MDKVDKKSVDGLIMDGENLYTEFQTQVESFVKVIIEERYAPKVAPAPPAWNK